MTPAQKNTLNLAKHYRDWMISSLISSYFSEQKPSVFVSLFLSEKEIPVHNCTSINT